MSALRELVDILAICRVHTLRVQASGSGDDGSIEQYELFDEQEEPFENEDTHEYDNVIETLVERAFDEKGFDYYNGDGGSISLTITVAERKCDWNAYVIEEVFCEDASNEEIV